MCSYENIYLGQVEEALLEGEEGDRPRLSRYARDLTGCKAGAMILCS